MPFSRWILSDCVGSHRLRNQHSLAVTVEENSDSAAGNTLFKSTGYTVDETYASPPLADEDPVRRRYIR